MGGTGTADEAGVAGGSLFLPALSAGAVARPAGPAAGARHAVRAGADRRPAPRAPRQRALHVGHRAGDRRTGDPADRGPRSSAVAAGVRGRRSSTTSSGSGSSPTSRRRGVPRRADAISPVGRGVLRTRPRSTGSARPGSCTPASARGPRSRRTRRQRGRPWRGIGCPGDCRDEGTPRGRGHGPAGGRRGRLGALDRPPGGAVADEPAARRRPPGPRPATATGRTRCAWSSTTCATASTS